MALEIIQNADCSYIETNRHSPNIFNRNSVPSGVSRIRNKLDFMRSLDLRSLEGTILVHSKINWDVFSQKISLPLKECLVMLYDIDDCSEHSQNYSKEYLDEMKENYEKQVSQHKSLDYRNINSSMEEESGTTFVKRDHSHRHKDSVKKITLKIGEEVISNVFCKTKYLQRSRHKKRGISKPIQNEVKSSDTGSEHSVQMRKMATALVKLELERRILELQRNINSEEKLDVQETNEDALMPNDSFEENNNPLKQADDVQKGVSDSEFLNKSEKELSSQAMDKLVSKETKVTANYEVITIDDENDLEDDCVIIDEHFSRGSSNDEKESYVFRVYNRGDICAKTLNAERTLEVYSSSLGNEENYHRTKKIKIDHRIDHKFDVRKRINCDEISMFFNHTLPLRLLNARF